MFQGVVLVLLSAIMLAFKGILIKLCYAEGINTIPMLFMRLLMASPMYWVLVYFHDKRAKSQLNLKAKYLFLCFLAGIFGYYISSYADFMALKYVDVGVSRLVLFIFPMFVIILNAFIERKMPPKMHIAMFFMIQIGLYFVMGGYENVLFNQNQLKGFAFVIGAAFFYSLYIIINQAVGKKIGSILFTSLAVTISFIVFCVHFVLTQDLSSLVTTFYGYIYLFLLAFFCTFLPLLFFTEGIKQIGASRASLISSISPFIAIIFAYIVLGEVISFAQICGGIIIILAILLLENKLKLSYFKFSYKKH